MFKKKKETRAKLYSDIRDAKIGDYYQSKSKYLSPSEIVEQLKYLTTFAPDGKLTIEWEEAYETFRVTNMDYEVLKETSKRASDLEAVMYDYICGRLDKE